MQGQLWGQKDRRNTQDGDWKRVEMPLLAHLQRMALGRRHSRHKLQHPAAKGQLRILIDACQHFACCRLDDYACARLNPRLHQRLAFIGAITSVLDKAPQVN